MWLCSKIFTMFENASTEEVEKVTLRVLMDKEKNKVLFAEADKDFINILLSFLTLPLGTIARLVAKESDIEAVRFGSISSLYQSVADLDQQYLWSHTCKEMLLKPKNSITGVYRQNMQNMKLNIDDTGTMQDNFRCANKTCIVENRYCVSYFRNLKCICGKLLNRQISRVFNKEIGFVNENSTFIVSDDLYVMPNVVSTSLSLLQKHGINDIDAIDKQIINISKKQVVDILKLSLISKTPLTDFIFKKEPFVGKLDPRKRLQFWIGDTDEPSDESNEIMVVKVLRRKSTEHILFIEAEEDFADFVFSFLTLPFGAVLRMVKGFSSISCIDNLYKSTRELSSDRCLMSHDSKEMLTNPTISPQSELKNQILPIPNSNYKEIHNSTFKFVDPKSPVSGGYANGPLTFMVTNDLVVTPMSSIDGISYIEKMNVPLNDVEEMAISIGQKEGLSILKASLTSTSVLTNGLNQYIGSRPAQADLSSNARPQKKPKVE